jgi:hypothetical protein
MDIYVKLIILIIFYIFINYLCNCKDNNYINVFHNLHKNDNKKLQESLNNKVFSKHSNIQSGYDNEILPKMEIIYKEPEIICGKDNLNIDDKILKLDDKLKITTWGSNQYVDQNQDIIENIIYMDNVKYCDFL